MSAGWPGYEDAFALDMLATPGPFNIGGVYDHPLTAEMIANVRCSGITAVNVTLSPLNGSVPAFVDATSNLAYWEREFAAHPDVLLKARTVADIHEAKRSGRLAIILGFQDGVAIEGGPAHVEVFHSLGVRVIQLTYNGRNLLGDGCSEPANAGLSRLGHACVERMDELGVLIDLSHVGRQTSWDAVRASRRPVAVTHAGAAAITDLPRNKPDDLLRAIANKGGVVGLYLMPYLRRAGQPHAEDAMRHLEHLIDVCGEDHVGIGTDQSITPLEITDDFRARHAAMIDYRAKAGIGAPGEAADVFTYVPEFNSPRRLEQIAEAMAAAGHSAARIEKVIGGNWMRLLGEVWGG